MISNRVLVISYGVVMIFGDDVQCVFCLFYKNILRFERFNFIFSKKILFDEKFPKILKTFQDRFSETSNNGSIFSGKVVP